MVLGIRTGLRTLFDRITRRQARLIAEYLHGHATKKLHIGCGENHLEGWLNCDLHPKSRSVLPLDATRPLPFDDGQFDFIFSEHFIEHINYEQCASLLRECRRILKPGGKIRLTTPDLAFLIDLYREPKTEEQQRYIEWATKSFIKNAPRPRDVYVINNFFYCDWGHQFIYDEESLAHLMRSVGFVNVERCAISRSADDALRGLENETRMPAGFLRLESVTLEGQGA